VQHDSDGRVEFLQVDLGINRRRGGGPVFDTRALPAPVRALAAAAGPAEGAIARVSEREERTAGESGAGLQCRELLPRENAHDERYRSDCTEQEHSPGTVAPEAWQQRGRGAQEHDAQQQAMQHLSFEQLCGRCGEHPEQERCGEAVRHTQQGDQLAKGVERGGTSGDLHAIHHLNGKEEERPARGVSAAHLSQTGTTTSWRSTSGDVRSCAAPPPSGGGRRGAGETRTCVRGMEQEAAARACRAQAHGRARALAGAERHVEAL
jgi:hypothetical protein